MGLLGEKKSGNRELDKKIEGISKVSSSYFKLTGLLTGFNVSALFIYIAIPGEYNLTLFNSIIVFFLTISLVLFISGVLLSSFIYERINRLKQETNQDLNILKKKLKFNQYDLDLARNCTIVGESILLSSIFYLIWTIDLYLRWFTVISSFIVFFIVGIIRIFNFKRSGLTKIKNGKKIKINKIRLLIIIAIFIILTIIMMILDLFFK